MVSKDAQPFTPRNLRTSSANVDYSVRCVRRLSNGGRKSHPGTGSLHPVAIEAAAEETKSLEAFGGEGRCAKKEHIEFNALPKMEVGPPESIYRD
jgi:hypothetical protein